MLLCEENSAGKVTRCASVRRPIRNLGSILLIEERRSVEVERGKTKELLPAGEEDKDFEEWTSCAGT